mmetsp:Transcript_76911/g.160017  ORF Transcript_76911/g.160017 Transcript_76911/m.160017 type:complete len:146 (-) Transcript_76911:722-1159(-)
MMLVRLANLLGPMTITIQSIGIGMGIGIGTGININIMGVNISLVDAGLSLCWARLFVSVNTSIGLDVRSRLCGVCAYSSVINNTADAATAILAICPRLCIYSNIINNTTADTATAVLDICTRLRIGVGVPVRPKLLVLNLFLELG